jgi:hypothetical protein
LQRTQLVCENCGGLVSLDVGRLRSGLEEDGRIGGADES